ncbi:MAG: hypothetical protein ACOCVF_03635 [bacterium]
MPTTDKIQNLNNMINLIEEKKQAKIIPFNQLPIDLQNWLLLGKFASPDYYCCYKRDNESFQVEFHLSKYKISIYGYPSHEKHKEGYLGGGCIYQKQKPYETWHRGNDLPDGDWSYETFIDIMLSALNIEKEIVDNDVSKGFYENSKV